jgi:hypothetical protein
MPFDPFGRAYLTLTLEIAKHIEGYVDAYFGPAELKVGVDASPRKTPAALLDDVARLQDALPHDNPARHAYLSAVMRAMDCSLRMLNGETVDYVDEIHRLFDVQPVMADQAVFEAARRNLETILPGKGDIGERLEARRKQLEIPADRLARVAELALEETRQRTRRLVDLVDGESVEFRLTADQPWSGYNWYQGGARSLVEVNTDIPFIAVDIVSWAAHEAYPGHHTEHQLKEKRLYQELGRAECAAQLLQSPSAVISEGIATTAVEIIFPGGSQYAWTADVILPEAGLETVLPDELRAIDEMREMGRRVSLNAAILYHSGQLSEEQTVDYIRSHALATEKRARQSFSFITSPLFRSYPCTYTQGYDLIALASHGGDKTPVFKRLLAEEMLPSALGAM